MKATRLNAMIFTAAVSVATGMLVYTPLSAVGGCAHPGQSTVRAGQCLLDNGVLAEVLAALAKPDYLRQVGTVALSRASDLVDCALQAVATQPGGGSGSGSGSAMPAARVSAAAPESDTLAHRAREALAARRAR